jgi:hypothetical protein
VFLLHTKILQHVVSPWVLGSVLGSTYRKNKLIRVFMSGCLSACSNWRNSGLPQSMVFGSPTNIYSGLSLGPNRAAVMDTLHGELSALKRVSLSKHFSDKAMLQATCVGVTNTHHNPYHNTCGFMVQSFPDLGRRCISGAKYCRIIYVLLLLRLCIFGVCVYLSSSCQLALLGYPD